MWEVTSTLHDLQREILYILSGLHHTLQIHKLIFVACQQQTRYSDRTAFLTHSTEGKVAVVVDRAGPILWNVKHHLTPKSIFFPNFILKFTLVPTHRHDTFYKSHYNIKLIQFDDALGGRQLRTFRKDTTPSSPRIQRTLKNECTSELLKKKVIFPSKRQGSPTNKVSHLRSPKLSITSLWKPCMDYAPYNQRVAVNSSVTMKLLRPCSSGSVTYQIYMNCTCNCVDH